MDIRGPIVVSVSLMGTTGTVLKLGAHLTTRNPIAEDRLDISEILIQDISEAVDLDKITRPILDVLYQCHGERRCNFYGGEGKWTPSR